MFGAQTAEIVSDFEQRAARWALIDYLVNAVALLAGRIEANQFRGHS
jgi:hypothetical protein